MTDIETFRKKEFSIRELRLKNAKKQKLIITKSNPDRLHIVYVMTHVDVCGGSKIIFEHVNHLVKAGQKVSMVSHFEFPKWFPISSEAEYIKVPFENELALGIPSCDVIVATYWREIYECISRELAPVVYFEQGDYHLFDWNGVSQREKDYIYKQFQLVPFIFTVSKGASGQIKKVFGRHSTIINNAIDHKVFFSDDSRAKNSSNRNYTIAIIGSDRNEFKGINDIKKALSILKKNGYCLDLNWISPDEPLDPGGKVFINPKQEIIGEKLRESDFFVCASLYESFSLPVLEAMACGCAVITTKNNGVIEYAEDNKNCIMIAMNDPEDIAKKIVKLIKDDDLRESIITEGLKTSSRFTWEHITPRLINYYRKVSRFSPIHKSD